MSYNDSDDAYFVSYLFGTPEMNAKFVPDFNPSMVECMDDETNPIIVLTKFKTPSEMKSSKYNIYLSANERFYVFLILLMLVD